MIVILAGVWILVAGFQNLFTQGISAADFFLRGIVYVVMGFVVLIAGFALIRGRMWAWNLSFLVVLFVFGYSLYQGFTTTEGFTASVWFALALEIVALGYLIVVRRSFRRRMMVAAGM